MVNYIFASFSLYIHWQTWPRCFQIGWTKYLTASVLRLAIAKAAWNTSLNKPVFSFWEKRILREYRKRTGLLSFFIRYNPDYFPSLRFNILLSMNLALSIKWLLIFSHNPYLTTFWLSVSFKRYLLPLEFSICCLLILCA